MLRAFHVSRVGGWVLYIVDLEGTGPYLKNLEPACFGLKS